jgi:hypothetical protein
MEIRCEINEFNEINLYYGENDYPTLFQPHWPDGTEWSSYEEAKSWADLYIASVNEPSAPYAPNGPDQPALPKPTPEQLEKYREKMEKEMADEKKAWEDKQAAQNNN